MTGWCALTSLLLYIWLDGPQDYFAEYSPYRFGTLPLVGPLLTVLLLPTLVLLWESKKCPNTICRRILCVLSGYLFFIYLNLEVRQAFHGEDLRMLEGLSQIRWAEILAYSIAWALFSVGMLMIGMWVRSQALRATAHGLMLLTVAKVFLWDTRHLGELYCVAAFLALGMALSLLVYLHGRRKLKI